MLTGQQCDVIMKKILTIVEDTNSLVKKIWRDTSIIIYVNETDRTRSL